MNLLASLIVAIMLTVSQGILTGKATEDAADLLLLDVVPLTLGVAMEGNIFAPVVPRGSTVPTIKKISLKCSSCCRLIFCDFLDFFPI